MTNSIPLREMTGSRTAKKRRRGMPTLAVTVLATGTLGAGTLGATGLAASPALAASSLEVRTATLPAAIEGTVYRAKLAAADGTGPYTWSIASGTLPAGLTLVPATGLITGIPSLQAPANDQVTVEVSDSGTPAATATATLTIQVQVPPSAQLTTTSLPTATAGVHYSQKLAVTGGTAPYTWSIAGGALPPGLTLQPGTGVISGSPKAGGRFRFTAQVSGATYGKAGPASTTATATLSLTVEIAQLSVTTGADLPPAIVGVPYSVKLAAAGGITPYTWTLDQGELPPGLKLNAATGVISGTPAVGCKTDGAPCGYTFEVEANDSGSPSQSAVVSMSFAVQPSLEVTSTSLPPGVGGASYVAQLSAAGGTAPYTWSLTDPSQLPAGLALAPDGSITGVLAAADTGMGVFTVQVTDAEDPPVSVTATVTLPMGFNIQP